MLRQHEVGIVRYVPRWCKTTSLSRQGPPAGNAVFGDATGGEHEFDYLYIEILSVYMCANCSVEYGVSRLFGWTEWWWW